MRRLGIIGIGITMVAVLLTPGTAGAAVRHVDGGLSGPSSYAPATCAGGLTNISGTGTFAAGNFGIGTYKLEVCVTQLESSFSAVGTALFTTRSGAKVRGTIDSSFPSGQLATYTVKVTGGTKRYSRVLGTLVMGPLTQSDFRDCDAGGICSTWTDAGALTGTLRRVAPRHP